MAKYDLPEPPAPPIGLSEGRRKGLFSRLFSRKKDVLSEIKIEPILTSELDYEEKKGLAELEKKERLAKKHISKEQEFLHITKQKILEATSKVKSGRDVDKIKELLKHKTQIIDQKEKRVMPLSPRWIGRRVPNAKVVRSNRAGGTKQLSERSEL